MDAAVETRPNDNEKGSGFASPGPAGGGQAAAGAPGVSPDANPVPAGAPDGAAAAPGGLALVGEQHAAPKSEFEEKFIAALLDIVCTKAEGSGGIFAKNPEHKRADVVARLINLSNRLARGSPHDGVYRQAYFAANLLKTNHLAAGTVMRVLDDIDFASSRNSPIYTVMRGLTLSVVILILIPLAALGAFAWLHAQANGFSWQSAVLDPVTSLATSKIVIAAFFGVLGSVVSILLRLSEFEDATRRSRQFLAMTGFMLPLVGAVFACVTCALFASGIVNFNFANPGAPAAAIDNPYFYVVVGFLSGFSERFTRGLLGAAERTISREAVSRETSGAGTVETVKARQTVEQRGRAV